MKKIQTFESFINEAIDLKDAKDYLEKRGNEFQEQKSDYVEFYSEEYDANIFVYKNGDVEIHSSASTSFYKKIKKVEDLYDVISEFGDWYGDNVDEDMGTVVDVAMGVAVGVAGLWALVQGLPVVGRVLGDAAEALANRAEAKAKQAAKGQRKELIGEIIKKFDGDAKLKQMYNDLPEYSDKTANARKRELTTIGNYIKTKLTPEEMKYFTDISSMLRTGDVR